MSAMLDTDPINQACPFLDECDVRAKNASIETGTLVPPKAKWLYAAGDAVEVIVLTCRTHKSGDERRQFAIVPYTNPDREPDVAVHELTRGS